MNLYRRETVMDLRHKMVRDAGMVAVTCVVAVTAVSPAVAARASHVRPCPHNFAKTPRT